MTKDINFIEKDKKIATMLGDIEDINLGKHIVFEKPKIKPSNAMQKEQTAFLTSIINKHNPLINLLEATKALYVAEEISKQITRYK